MFTPTTTPGQNYIVLEIDDVDVPTRIARCFDKTKAPLMASFRESPGGLLRIPSIGERWTAKQQGWIWHLEAKLDNLNDHAFTIDNMAPGDTRVQSDGALFIQMTSATMNGRGIGPDIKDTFYDGVGFSAVYLTSEAVSLMSTHPKLNGIDLDPSLWELGADNRTITFYNLMGAGYLVVSYQSWATAMDDAEVVAGRGVISAEEVFIPFEQFVSVPGRGSAKSFGGITIVTGGTNVSVPGKTSAAAFGAVSTGSASISQAIFGAFYLGQDPPA